MKYTEKLKWIKSMNAEPLGIHQKRWWNIMMKKIDKRKMIIDNLKSNKDL